MSTVLLLHGPGRGPRALRPLADRLAALGHVVAVPALPPGVDEAGAVAAAALSGPAVVVGAAGGHRAAAALAVARPDDVRALVLCSPSPPGPLLPHVAAVLRTSLCEVPSLKPALLREDLRPGLSARVRALRAALRGELPAPSVPTTVVVGEHDAAVPLAAARHLAARLPDGRLVLVEGGAHELHWSAPQVVARLVDGIARGERVHGPVLVTRRGAEDPLAPPRRVPVRLHAALDLAGAAAALALPRLLRASPRTRAVLRAAAAAELLATAATDHPSGVARRLPVPLHLNLDSGGGLLLLAAAAAVLRGAPRRERAAVAALGLAGVVLADVSSAPAGPARLVTDL